MGRGGGISSFRLLAPVFLLLTACGAGEPPDTALPFLQRIPVSRDQVYDLSGYADEGEGNPFNLFDENANADPRYPGPGRDFAPVTNCQPAAHREIYFGVHGSRIVVDLLHTYRLQEIWIYDRSAQRDSVALSTGTLRKWNPLPGYTSTALWQRSGWKRIAAGRETRFLQIAFSSPATQITEMVLYGEPVDSFRQAASPGPSGGSTSPVFTRKPLNRFLGVNYIMEDDPQWLKPFHYSRLYNFALDFDNDTIHADDRATFNMLHYGYYDSSRRRYVFKIDSLQQVNDGEIWYSVRGVSLKMSKLGFGERDRPVDRVGLDPENPASYARHARMMFNLAGFFGYSAIDTHLLSLSHRPAVSGRRNMHLYENGNEEDAWWEGKKYADPVMAFAQSSADWDGDEGRLGKNAGIHAADSTAGLMMSGLVGLDTNRVKVYALLSDQLRNDHRFVWTGGVQYHHYSNRDGHGISPEADSLREKLTAVRNTTRRVAPGVDCFLGETGYDKNPASLQGVPLLPGYSAAQSQAILLVRTINACFFSGFDATLLFWLKDPDGDFNRETRTYLSSGLLRNTGAGGTQVYPSWNQVSGLVKALGNYVPDSIISEKGDVWLYRYRHALHPDSLACVAWCPTVTGKRIPGYVFDPGPVKGGSVSLVSLSDSTDRNAPRSIPLSGGRVVMEAGEKPVLIFWRR